MKIAYLIAMLVIAVASGTAGCTTLREHGISFPKIEGGE